MLFFLTDCRLTAEFRVAFLSRSSEKRTPDRRLPVPKGRSSRTAKNLNLVALKAVFFCPFFHTGNNVGSLLHSS